jgi:hypothetical protein
MDGSSKSAMIQQARPAMAAGSQVDAVIERS